LVTSTVETKMGSTSKIDDGVHKIIARFSSRPKRPPLTRNEDFFMGSVHNKTSVVANSVSGNNYVSGGQTCVCDQNLCDLNPCKVQQIKLTIDKDYKCTGMERNHATRKLNPKNTLDDHNNNHPPLSQLKLHKQPIKIYHQSIRSQRYKVNELLCHLSHDPPHILCVTEHHHHHEELASFHVENYVLGSCYCRKSKYKGGVCIFVHFFFIIDFSTLQSVQRHSAIVFDRH
jgi:hypothetical protein